MDNRRIRGEKDLKEGTPGRCGIGRKRTETKKNAGKRTLACFLLLILGFCPRARGENMEHQAVRQAFFKRQEAVIMHPLALEGLALAAADVLVLYVMIRLHSMQIKEKMEASRQDMRMQHEFFSKMSHELRTPMNIIAGLSELTCSLPGLPVQAVQNLQQLNTAAHYTVGLIGEILDINRMELGRMELHEEAFSLQLLLDELAAMMAVQAEQAGVKLAVERSMRHCWVCGDAMRLRQVLMNLLSNAVKFTPPGGQVRLSVREAAGDEQRAAYAFSVADTGRGIAEEDRERIFRAFEQAGNGKSRSMGTGLGLPISRQIVEAMGGALRVQSELGQGSCFFFSICLDFAQCQPACLPHAPLNIAGMRILLAEDNALSAAISQELLERRGALVDAVQNGAEAVAFFEQKGYDAILMDLHMPEMGGMEAARRIRSKERGGHVRIIAMSGSTFQEEKEEALSAGMDGYLVKPVEICNLCRMLLG